MGVNKCAISFLDPKGWPPVGARCTHPTGCNAPAQSSERQRPADQCHTVFGGARLIALALEMSASGVSAVSPSASVGPRELVNDAHVLTEKAEELPIDRAADAL